MKHMQGSLFADGMFHKKIVRFEEEIISKDKYLSMFSKLNGGYYALLFYKYMYFPKYAESENWGI